MSTPSSNRALLLLVLPGLLLAACEAVSDEVDRVVEAWTTSALPEAEQEGERTSLLEGVEPLPMLQRVYADPRSAPAPPPHSLRSTVLRFLPGWEMDRAPPAFRLIEGQRFRFDLPVHAGACYGVVAFSDEIQRLDVDVLSRETRWAQDFRQDAWPVATFCAPESRLLTIEIRAIVGAGEGQVMVLREPMSWRSFAPPGGLSTPAADPLGGRLDRLQAEVAPRSQPVLAPAALHLTHREMARVEFEVHAPGCHVLLVASLPPVEALAVRLQNAHGESAEDRQGQTVGSAMLCSAQAGTLVAEVAPLRGHGEARLVLMRMPDASP